MDLYNLLALIGLLSSALLAVVALIFCHWIIFTEILTRVLKRLKVYKLFIEFILNYDQFKNFKEEQKINKEKL